MIYIISANLTKYGKIPLISSSVYKLRPRSPEYRSTWIDISKSKNPVKNCFDIKTSFLEATILVLYPTQSILMQRREY